MRSLRVKRWMSLTGALCAALGVQTSALAQGVALDRFEPAPTGDRMFGVESPFTAGESTPHVAMLLDYAHNPYTLKHGPGHADSGAVVSDQLFLHLNATMALFNRVTLNFNVPAAVSQSGSDPTDGRTVYLSPHDSVFGDVRVGARVTIYGSYNDPFQLAVSGYLWIPTGARDQFVSDGVVRGMPSVVIGGRTSRIVWSFSSGVAFRPTQVVNGIQQGIQLHAGGGLGFLFGDGKVQIGPEVKSQMVLKQVDLKTTNAELLLNARYRLFDDFELGLGVGPGLTSGFGTPDVRVVGMIAFSPKGKGVIQDRDGDGVADADDQCPDVAAPREANPQKPGCPALADRDHDGVADAVDACPDTAGVASPDVTKNGCPADRDGDGIADAADACPDAAGPANQDAAKNGCPPPKDEDGDGIPDPEDACPAIAGLKSSDPKQNGCPGDRDGDGFRDDLDACPDVKGVAHRNPKRNGCPRARIAERSIDINEQVEFDTGKATIQVSSDHLLEEVAGIFKEHPEIAKVEVQGHTDNVGGAAANKRLSQSRADAVKTALVKRGVEAKRLVAKGYGEEQPLADNASEDGRAQNRRVQFVIVEKKDAKNDKPKAEKPKAKAPAAPAKKK
ncbi:outer membrane protein OmpA [Minicystis rosea]|nr:outer membrane protein OmpA [Minicystis rosea]